ncbi:hypothetical protein AB0C96_17145 [Streptomyces sp. NPDC048506]|uniref:hypothetical protein n=1 Tax=Streptomyces sp. NPDC048506 TaxID=3155028 RepID=UPI00341FFFDB
MSENLIAGYAAYTTAAEYSSVATGAAPATAVTTEDLTIGIPTAPSGPPVTEVATINTQC